jgi:predicted ATPase
LVLVNNCEHLVSACAKVADALLRGCPNLALLATSREPLGIDGEQVYRIPSMATPFDGDDAGAIQASEAVRLFEDRAAAQGVRLAWDEPAAERPSLAPGAPGTARHRDAAHRARPGSGPWPR